MEPSKILRPENPAGIPDEARRVISGDFDRYSDILSAVDSLPDPVVIIGIDGMCASGKSTLGRSLAEKYSGNLFHADDYFLPASLRTPERLSEPGGNMHRERLLAEVLEPLRRGGTAISRRFDCAKMELGSPVEHKTRRVNIVEGSYSLHPELRGLYTLKLALRTTPERQLERLRARDPKRLRNFIERWIPLEDRYFMSTDLFDSVDILIET